MMILTSLLLAFGIFASCQAYKTEQQLKKDFKQFDKDGDGHLNLSELGAALDLPPDYAKLVMDAWDQDHDGKISLDQYLVMQNPTDFYEMMEKDEEGRIGFDKVRKFFQQSGLENSLSPQDINEMIDHLKIFDVDKDGKLNKDEWEQFMIAIFGGDNGYSEGDLLYFFKELDRDHDGFLNVQELSAIFESENDPEGLVREIFQEFHVDEDKGINFEEFQKILEYASEDQNFA